MFTGELWFPEPNEKYQGDKGPYVMSGRNYDWDMSPLYKNYYEELGPSRHYTNVFNIFVWLQIVNMINGKHSSFVVNKHSVQFLYTFYLRTHYSKNYSIYK